MGVALRFMLALLFAAMAGPAAARSVQLCYNYGCQSSGRVEIASAELAVLRGVVAAAPDAESERLALAWAVARLYRIAGTQLPVAADHAGDLLDAGVDGRMDCIDHAVDTTRLLALFSGPGGMRFHRLMPPALRERFLIFQHFSAQLEALPEAERSAAPEGDAALLSAWLKGCPVCAPESSSRAATDSEPESGRYVIDSWFVEPGEPAVVLPLDDWLDGGGPNVQ